MFRSRVLEQSNIFGDLLFQKLVTSLLQKVHLSIKQHIKYIIINIINYVMTLKLRHDVKKVRHDDALPWLVLWILFVHMFLLFHHKTIYKFINVVQFEIWPYP